jgi:hypothetical protein
MAKGSDIELKVWFEERDKRRKKYSKLNNSINYTQLKWSQFLFEFW